MKQTSIKEEINSRLGESVECTNKRKLNVHPIISDIRRWSFLEDRQDILSVLTWQTIRNREFPHLLIIPRKLHAKGHSVLKEFYGKNWADNRECVFNDDGACRIAGTAPECCLPKNPKNKAELIEQFFKEFRLIHNTKEALSKMIVEAKKIITPETLKNLLARDHEYTSSKSKDHTESPINWKPEYSEVQQGEE